MAAPKDDSDEGKRSIARNPRATHDYHIMETWEAGLVLKGTEVKSLRDAKATLVGAFARLHNGEVLLEGLHITPYEMGNHYNHLPDRYRKLLLHRREIERMIGAVEQKGLTLVPLEQDFAVVQAREGTDERRLGIAEGLHFGPLQHEASLP